MGTVTVGSLCSGAGMLDLAVCAHYDAEVAWHAEIDRDASAVLEKRRPGVPNLGDLTAVGWSAVEPVDIMTAGLPCQPFSTAGQRKGLSDERHLWPAMARAVGELRPRVIVLENVPRFLAVAGAGVIADLASLGYVGRWGVVPASAAGASHRRDRLFIVAHAEHDGRDQRPIRRGADEIAAQGELLQPEGRCPSAAPDADSEGRQGRIGPADGPNGRARLVASGSLDWAEYAGAVRRWERILGRPAPTDALVGRQLNAKLSEWIMGLPDGWVTDVLPNRRALKVIGNGVCVRQAALALRLLDPPGIVDACSPTASLTLSPALTVYGG